MYVCSKCHENIPQGKEMQIKGTIICKECALVVEKTNKEKIVSRCWNCNELICEGDLIHESFRNNSKSWVFLFSIGSKNSEKMVQCDECYQAWRGKVKKAEKWLKARERLLFFCTGLFLSLAVSLFFPEKVKKMYNDTPITLILFILLFIIVFILGPLLEVNRYETREREKKKEKTKK